MREEINLKIENMQNLTNRQVGEIIRKEAEEKFGRGQEYMYRIERKLKTVRIIKD